MEARSESKDNDDDGDEKEEICFWLGINELI